MYEVTAAAGFKVAHIYGAMDQSTREERLQKFRRKQYKFLIVTDLAARGIDIKGLSWILNFYLPKTPIYYLHRCGRTARAGSSGMVFNFVTNHDAKIIANINEAIKKI